MPLADVLQYGGNAALAGVGESVIDLSPALNAYQGFQNRLNAVADREYQQKIADRDTSFKAIANMQADLDKMLPENRGAVEGKVDEISKIITKPGFFEDPTMQQEYFKKFSEFKIMNAHAKTNYKTVMEDRIAAMQEVDPELRQRKLDHIAQQQKALGGDIYKLYDPFKPELGADFEQFAPKGSTLDQMIDKGNYTKDKFTYTNVPELLQQYEQQQVDAPGSVTKNKWDVYRNAWISENRNPEERLKEIMRMNEKVVLANKWLPEGQKIKLIPNEFSRGFNNGVPEFTESFTKNDFDKAMLVANRYKETMTTGILDEERAKLDKTLSDIKENEAQITKLKDDAQSNRIRANAYAAAQQAKASMEPKQAAETAVVFNTLLSKVQIGGLTTVDSKGNKSRADVIFTEDVPESYQYINGLGITTGPDGKQNKLAPIKLEPFKDKKTGKGYYVTKYFDVKSGQPISPFDKKDNYELTKRYTKALSDAGFKDPKEYPYEQYLRGLAKKGAIGTSFVGQNGTSDINGIHESRRGLNNLSASSKVDDVIND